MVERGGSERDIQVQNGELFRPFDRGIYLIAGPEVGEIQSYPRSVTFLKEIRAVLSPEKDVADKITPYETFPDVHPTILSIQINKAPNFINRALLSCTVIVDDVTYQSNYLDIVNGRQFFQHAPQQHLRFCRFSDESGREVPVHVPWVKGSEQSLKDVDLRIAVVIH